MTDLDGGRLAAHVDEEAAVRAIRVDGYPVADMIGLTVRDPDWREIPGQQLDRSVSADGARVTDRRRFEVGTAIVEADWTVAVASNQLAVTATLRSVAGTALLNRGGLVVLHPLELVGRSVRLDGPDGSRTTVFPTDVDPWAPFRAVRQLRFVVPSGSAVSLSFAGGLFETEDHRNWADAGWKSYSPPLADPAPFRLEPGQENSHQVTLSVTPGHGVAAATDEPLSLAIGQPSAGRLPRIGWGAATELGQRARASVHPSGFLHGELVDGPDARRRLARLSAQAASLHLPLRLTLVAAGTDLPAWAEGLRQVGPLASVCLVDIVRHVASPRQLAQLRQLLDGSGIEIAGGTRGYLAELLRGGDTDSGADRLQLSVSSQVHHTDAELVLDTTRAFPYVVAELRRRAGRRPISILPVTLAQRTTMHEAAALGDVPWPSRFAPDPRGEQAFGAAWAVAAIAGLAGADEVGFGSLQPGAGLARADGSATPAAHVLRELASWAGSPLRVSTSSDPRRMAGLAVDLTGGPRVVLANLRPQPVRVVLAGVARGLIELEPYGVHIGTTELEDGHDD